MTPTHLCVRRRRLSISLFALSVACLGQQREVEPDWPNESAEWFYNQRTYPSGQIPLSARVTAFTEIQRLDRAARAGRPLAAVGVRAVAAVDGTTWTFIGPRPTADLGPASSSIAGRVPALAIDPRDSNTIYLGAASGGVWKTTDGGVNWKPIGDDQPSLAVGSIALDPKNPDTVYVGTGEGNFSDNGYYGVGILKSTNGGASWTNIQGPFLHAYIGTLAVSPANSQVLLCTTGTGVWRSSDGASSWSRVLVGVGTSAVFDSTNGGVAYAALGDRNGSALNGVYRSSDGGQTWNAVRGSGANAVPTPSAGRIALALAPSTPTTLFVAIENRTTGGLLDIYKSTDSGGTWTALKAPDICPKGQCGYDIAIAVHPKNSNVVYAAGDHAMARTLDGGAMWSEFVDGQTFIGPNGVAIHVDEHVLAFTPDGTKLYLGNDGGLYSTADVMANQVSQVNWTDLNNTLGITQFYPGFSIHPSNLKLALGGTQDNRTQLYSGGLAWQAVVCGDGGYTAFDISLPSVAFATCTSKDPPPVILRSTDSGNTWRSAEYGVDLSDRAAFIPPLIVDSSNPRIVYYGTYRLWQSRDSGGKFAPISPDLTAGGTDTITAIAVAPSDGNTVYVGTSSPRPSEPARVTTPKVQVTNNVLEASPAWNDRSKGLPPRVITRITIDPIDSATAYATFSGFATGTDSQGHVFRTTNAGGSWTDISGNLPNLPVNDLVIDPDLPNTLYIATDLGVMASSDGGSSWSSLGNGLPKVVVQSLVLHRATRTLRAATYGRSVWDISVPLASLSLQPSLLSLSPSSVNAGATGFTLQATGASLVTGTVLRWNGSSRPTTIVDSGHLNATISASDIAHVGRVVIDVFNPYHGAGASNALNLAIGPAPASSSQAFVNAAFPTGGSSLAPGSIASLFGTNLSGTTVLSDQPPPLPLELGETRLSISTVSLPLFFVSPTQINFQLPYFPTLTGPARETLNISQGTLSSSVSVTVTPFAPGMFTTNAQGTGQASALISGTASLAAPNGAYPGSRPARKGEYVSFYCTGLGDLTNRPTLGAPAPATPPATTVATPSVTVGGANASVTFSGLAPGYVGLYQVNIQIPDSAPTGNAVPVVLRIGGATANTVTIAVQ